MRGGHLRCSLVDANGRSLRAVAWRCADTPIGRRLEAGGGTLHAAGKLKPDDWNGRSTRRAGDRGPRRSAHALTPPAPGLRSPDRRRIYPPLLRRSLRLSVRTSDFQSGKRGSTPLGTTKFCGFRALRSPRPARRPAGGLQDALCRERWRSYPLGSARIGSARPLDHGAPLQQPDVVSAAAGAYTATRMARSTSSMAASSPKPSRTAGWSSSKAPATTIWSRLTRRPPRRCCSSSTRSKAPVPRPDTLQPPRAAARRASLARDADEEELRGHVARQRLFGPPGRVAWRRRLEPNFARKAEDSPVSD